VVRDATGHNIFLTRDLPLPILHIRRATGFHDKKGVAIHGVLGLGSSDGSVLTVLFGFYMAPLMNAAVRGRRQG
jgi:hypothetical protein